MKPRSGTMLQLVALAFALLMCDQLLQIHMRNQVDALAREAKALKASIDASIEESEKFGIETARLTVQDKELDERIQRLSQASMKKPEKIRQIPSSMIGTVRLQNFQKNKVVMEGPFCSKLKKKNKDLPLFVFVAGVEGSGHHSLHGIWNSLKKHMAVEQIVFDQKFHSLDINNHASYQYSKVDVEAHKQAMQPIFEQFKQSGGIVVDTQNSYPMGMFAGSLAHPDLLMLNELDGVLFDLRVIVLLRDLTDAAMSAVRRFTTTKDAEYKTPQFQARMMSENLASLNNMLPLLGCEKWMALQFEDFVSNPKQFVGPFARLLGFPKTHFDGAFDSVRKPSAKAYNVQQQAERAILADFFQRQQVLWPLIAAASTT
eukprot:m.362993 g.362993  ORF g.362993 m.362993 type:complete len:373 (+) comp21305_c0_seq1:176-1294(+)